MKVRNLVALSDEELYQAFSSAFKDYEVNVEMSLEKFKKVTYAKDFNHDLSVGCFKRGELAGFLLIGYRNCHGRKKIYNIVTGVIPEYQNQGVGRMMLEKVIRKLKKEKIQRLYLEVLENNSTARKLYESCGFAYTRRLKCFEKAVSKCTAKDPIPGLTEDCSEDKLLYIKESEFVSFKPAWQNRMATYRNSKSDYDVITLCNAEDELIAYGFINTENGDVLQLGIHPEYRNDDLTDQLIRSLSGKTRSHTIRFINVEENSKLCRYLEDSDFKNFINQHEMVYKLDSN